MTAPGFLARLEDHPGAAYMVFVAAGWVATFPYFRNPTAPLSGLIDLVGRPATVAALGALTLAWLAVLAVDSNTSRAFAARFTVAALSAGWWSFVSLEFIAARGLDSPAWWNTASFAAVSMATMLVERRRWAVVLAAEDALERELAGSKVAPWTASRRHS